MIAVTFISMCEKQALEKTKSILDSFAIRIGQATWKTYTTYNALNKIIKKLKATATKNTSIGVYIINNKKTSRKLYKIIGRNLFNELGGVPISYSKKIHSQLVDYKLKDKYKLKDILKYMGFLHDFGKNNKEFQTKIRERNSNKSDSIRHEAISFLMLEQLLKNNQIDFYNLEQYNFLTLENLQKLEKFFYKVNTSKELSVLDLIKYVILTHHYIPKIKGDNVLQAIKDTYHFNVKNKEMYISKTFNHKIQGYFYNIVDDLFKLDKVIINKEEFTYLAVISREILMLTDHFISSKNQNIDKQTKDSQLLANKQQTLEYHLLHIADEVENTLELFFEDKEIHKKTKLDKSLFSSKQYEWQDKAYNYLKEQSKNKKNIKLVFNFATTGSGKTIANAKILEALKSNIYNVLYPLKSLTIQTGDVYYKQTKINPEKIAVIVGDLDEENPDISIYDSVSYQFKRNKKYQNLYEKDIVIATIDYFIRALDNKKSKFLLPFARLMKSDFIIDEIDNLNVEDIQTTLGLFYLLGVFKRKVVISSATLTKDLIYYISESYKKGYMLNSDNENNTFDIVLINENSYKLLKKYADIDKFKLKDTKQVCCGAMFSNDKNTSSVNVEIAKRIIKASNKNYEQISDKKISIGLVKFYSINDMFNKADKIIDYLLENDTTTNYKFIFFHSRSFFNNDKEKFMYKILTRKGNYLDVLDKTFENQNIKVIVFSTKIIDTGKDFDFDWGISEYTSLADIIQTAGRINRHRKIDKTNHNFYIFLNKPKNNLLVNITTMDDIMCLLQDTFYINNSLLKNKDFKIGLKEQEYIKNKLQESFNDIDENILLSSYFINYYKFRKSVSQQYSFCLKYNILKEMQLFYKKDNKTCDEIVKHSKLVEYIEKYNEYKDYLIDFDKKIEQQIDVNLYSNSIKYDGYFGISDFK